ncbi:MAG: hypothetical protein HKN87_15530 [Saprospiraceae bacterium]|nr:hypothetical protein [Saprospiraceae bacterium]
MNIAAKCLISLPSDFGLEDTETEQQYDTFVNCESISIDYAIRAKAENVYMYAAEFTWIDLGTWNSVWVNIGEDDLCSAVPDTNTLRIDASRCIVQFTVRSSF